MWKIVCTFVHQLNETDKNMATLKDCKQAGIKGLSEVKNSLSVQERIEMRKKDLKGKLPKFVILERFQGESFQDWKARCAQSYQSING